MKRKIDCPLGREMISRRFATVEPVFGNLRHNKRLHRFTLRGNYTDQPVRAGGLAARIAPSAAIFNQTGARCAPAFVTSSA